MPGIATCTQMEYGLHTNGIWRSDDFQLPRPGAAVEDTTMDALLSLLLRIYHTNNTGNSINPNKNSGWVNSIFLK